MRRAVAALVAALALSACTPAEIAAWSAWRDVDPVAADAHAEAVLADLAHGVCGEWRDLALEVGWPAEEWPWVNRIMFRESRCTPDAYNRSGASGLMQIMPMWADDCGGTRDDLFDPRFNLACALHVMAVQGPHAWSTHY